MENKAWFLTNWAAIDGGEVEANSNTIYHNNECKKLCNAMNAERWAERGNLNDNDQIRIVRFHLATTEKILGPFTLNVVTTDLNKSNQWLQWLFNHSHIWLMMHNFDYQRL